MATIFSRIVAGEIPSYKVAENERFYAFLDIAPCQRDTHWLFPSAKLTISTTSRMRSWLR